MLIHLTLYSLLRDLLPKDARGRADLDLPPASTLADLRARVGITGPAVFTVNGQLERDETHPLRDGDHVSVFRPAGGGFFELLP